MSTPGKRSAEEAFETGAGRPEKKHKKLNSSEKQQRDAAGEQLQREVAAQFTVQTPGTIPRLDSVPREASKTTASALLNPQDPPQSKKRHQKKQPTAKDAAQLVVDRPSALSGGQAEASKSQERRRKRKEKLWQKEGEERNTVHATPRQGDESQQPMTLNPANAEPVLELSVDQRKRRKKHKPEASATADPAAAAASLPNSEDRTKRDRKQRRRIRGKDQADASAGREEINSQTDDHGMDLQATCLPLEDRIEPPPSGGEIPAEIEGDEEGDDSDVSVVDPNDLAGLVPLEDRIEAPLKQKRVRHGKTHTVQEKWSVSTAVGGSFLEHDPILTTDDQHLILSTRSDVRVYSRSTSLLIRRLQPRLRNANEVLVGCAISKTNTNYVLIATSFGIVSAWDWSQGKRVRKWKVGAGLASIVSLSSESNVEHVVCTHRHPDEKESIVSIQKLDAFSKEAASTLVILKRKHLSPQILAFEETGVLVASTQYHLLIGYCPGFKSEDKATPVFYWRELKLPSLLVSLDARSTVENRAGNTPRLDIALGVQSGEILLYQDLLYRLMGKEKKNPNAEITARSLHWHRHAVSSVKWSSDGNYLVSGGQETVLVIWQLDTNNKQFLPHLTSEILSITVSEKGSSYALRLGDNSVMVLSTENLDATTNIPSLAAAANPQTQLAGVLHPISSDCLLIAVPRNATQKDGSAYALQTYDISTGYELGRQALVRNAATVVVTGSKGGSNYEPNVTHLSISNNGKWLATVEEWCADSEDLDGVTLTGEDELEEFGAETCLKIWLYNEARAEWELVNRIDNPHAQGNVKVLALQSSSCRNEFATAGFDGTVKIWRARPRVRDGVPVRNDQGEQLYNWGAASTVPCAVTSDGKRRIHYASAALAYSSDASVIAASWSQSEDAKPAPRWTYLIDVDSGKICHTSPNICSQGPCSMALVDRYLIALSRNICIFDTVTASVLSQTSLLPEFLGPRHLSASPLDGTVAIAVNPTYGKGPGRLAVIDVKKLDKSALFEQQVPGQIRALLSSPTTQGYTLIDGFLNVSQVRRTGRSAHAVSGAGEVRESEDVRKGLDRIFGHASSQERNAGEHQSQLQRLITDGEGRTAGKTLEELLRFQTSSEAPAVGELFDRVAGLFASTAATAVGA